MHNFAMLCEKEKDYLSAYYWFKRVWDRGLAPSGRNIEKMINDRKIHPSDIHISLYPTWEASILTRINPTTNPVTINSSLEDFPSEVISQIGVWLDVKTLFAFERTSRKLRQGCDYSWVLKTKLELHPTDLKKLKQPLSSQDIELRKLVYAQSLIETGSHLFLFDIAFYAQYGFINLCNAAELGSTKAAKLLLKHAHKKWDHIEEDKLNKDKREFIFSTIQKYYQALKPSLGKKSEDDRDLYDKHLFRPIKYGFFVNEFVKEINLTLLTSQYNTLVSNGNLPAALWCYNEENPNYYVLEGTLEVMSAVAERAKQLSEHEWSMLNKSERKYLLNSIYMTAREARNEKNYDEAMLLFELGANHGHRVCQFRLGDIFYNDKNIEDARHWFELSAKQGCIFSMHNLGVLSLQEGDMETAIYWLTIASLRGCKDSQNSLGIIYAKQGEIEIASHWWTLSHLLGNSNATHNLGLLTSYGN